MTRILHGTPEGYDAGCTTDETCPALAHGLTCTTAHYRYISAERRYMHARGQGLTPPQIARKLGLTTNHALAKPTDAAQPLAESSHDRMSDASAPTTDEPPEGGTPRDGAGIREEMGHPTPTKETPTMNNTQPLSKTLTQLERTQIRTWARDNGFTVPTRGILAGGIINAYRAAHPATPTDPFINVDPEPDTPPVAHTESRNDFTDILDETHARLADLRISRATGTATTVASVDLLSDVRRLEHERDQALAALELALGKWGQERELTDTLAEIAEHQHDQLNDAGEQIRDLQADRRLLLAIIDTPRQPWWKRIRP